MRTYYPLTKLSLIGLIILLGLNACQQEKNVEIEGPLFELLSPEKTGVTFVNTITEEPNNYNHLKWSYVYSGGGVAIGDINNDGLPDIFFAGNMVNDALYLNKGNMEFEDITTSSGILQDGRWSSGVTMGDINGDGFLDIYVSRMSPHVGVDQQRNLFYLNNGNNTFTESAAAYVIDNGGYSVQATFFDYDKDGDLDIYLVNQPPNNRLISRFNLDVSNMTELSTDRLYRNDGSVFTDVTRAAGFFNNAYGLNAVASDLNNDGWPDLYVSNDYGESDYMYMNNQDGTFTDKILEDIKHTSFYAMGCDVVDFNNDNLLDIAVVDMASSDHFRSKTNMGSMQPEVFWASVEQGKHYQYMFNTLQLNNGNGTFSDIGQLAGVSKTDWSWSILLADFDNDGWQDLSITNGINKDIRNNDFLYKVKQMANDGQNKFEVMDLLKLVPSNPLPNYIFRNNGDFTFTDMATSWGMDQPNFSHGAAYADLDQDGDLDMVINSTDQKGLIYENRWGNQRNYLRVKLQGGDKNKDALNSKVHISYGDKQQQVREATFTRGYLSASEPILHFGLGDIEKIDQLTISWYDGTQTTMKDVDPNQLLTIRYKSAERKPATKSALVKSLMAKATAPAFRHQENDFDDFEREILLPHKQSTNGPSLATADVNGDGLDDFYVGGAADQSGKLFLQSTDGTFAEATGQVWNADRQQEDVGALFFDAEGDGDADLYVVSGGSEWAPGSGNYQDRLYLNNGNGDFQKAVNALPQKYESGQAIAAADIDADGDLDLFVGGRIVPGKYPAPANSYLLLNEGGTFKDVTAEIAPNINPLGLVTDALFSDYDGDGDEDLLVVGEWMPLSILKNDNGQFVLESIDQSGGWWWSIAEGDFDGDGDMDYMAGNLGKNAKFKASTEKPFLVYQSDFDGNGTNDVVLAGYYQGKQVPVRGRECSSEQMPFIAEKFPTYEGFASAALEDIYTEGALENANKREVHTFYSKLILNEGGGKLSMHKLPIQAQFAPVQDIQITDINQDGQLDALLVGNLYGAEVETVRYDAGIGLCLIGDGQGGFRALSTEESGFFAPHDARAVRLLNGQVLVANNNEGLQLFKVK